MKFVEFVLLVLMVFLILVGLKAYLDKPTVLVDLQGNCVSVELPEGTGDCNNLPDVYITEIVER